MRGDFVKVMFWTVNEMKACVAIIDQRLWLKMAGSRLPRRLQSPYLFGLVIGRIDFFDYMKLYPYLSTLPYNWRNRQIEGSHMYLIDKILGQISSEIGFEMHLKKCHCLKDLTKSANLFPTYWFANKFSVITLSPYAVFLVFSAFIHIRLWQEKLFASGSFTRRRVTTHKHLLKVWSSLWNSGEKKYFSFLWRVFPVIKSRKGKNLKRI